MPASIPPRTLVEVLAGVTLVAVIASAFAVTRAVRRHVRSNARERTRDLLFHFAGHVAGSVPASRLRARVRETSAGVFWSALEAFSLRLGRREWLALSQALERNRHSASERAALRDESAWRRELAARRLALLAAADSRRALRSALRRGPEIVTLAAATGLARARDAKSLRWLLEHPDSLRTRPPAAWSGLLRAFGPRALPILSEALERGVPSRVLELAIVETLGLAQFRAATPSIVTRLREGDLESRVAAARALGRIHATECVPELSAALDDPCWQVRAQAARALGRVGSAFAVPRLAARLSDPSWWVRRHSAYALAELGQAGQDALRQAADGSPDRYARDIAREALDGGFKLGA